MRQRAFLLLGLVVVLLASSSGVANAAPVMTRTHLEFAVPVNECGLTTLDLSIDKISIVNVGPSVTTFTTIDQGIAVDRTTGEQFRFVDRSTQAIRVEADKPTVNTAQRTLVITGSSGTTLVVHAFVHRTILPDGTTTSETNLQFVRCNQATA